MAFKEWSAWMKGGFIIPMVYIIFSILFYFYIRLLASGDQGLIVLLIFLPAILIMYIIGDTPLLMPLSLILNLFFYFFMGMILGNFLYSRKIGAEIKCAVIGMGVAIILFPFLWLLALNFSFLFGNVFLGLGFCIILGLLAGGIIGKIKSSN
jgi:hypothetical protein